MLIEELLDNYDSDFLCLNSKANHLFSTKNKVTYVDEN